MESADGTSVSGNSDSVSDRVRTGKEMVSVAFSAMADNPVCSQNGTLGVHSGTRTRSDPDHAFTLSDGDERAGGDAHLEANSRTISAGNRQKKSLAGCVRISDAGNSGRMHFVSAGTVSHDSAGSKAAQPGE